MQGSGKMARLRDLAVVSRKSQSEIWQGNSQATEIKDLQRVKAWTGTTRVMFNASVLPKERRRQPFQ
jgi:hypothetical protein